MGEGETPPGVLELLQQQNDLYRQAVQTETERIQLETERIRLEKESLANLQRLQNTEQQRVKFLMTLEEKLSALLEFTPILDSSILATREWQEDAGKWMETIDRSLLLLLTTKRGSGWQQDVDRVLAELEVLSKKRQLIQHRQNRNELLEELARRGFDLEIKNRIREEEEVITELEKELSQLEKDLNSK